MIITTDDVEDVGTGEGVMLANLPLATLTDMSHHQVVRQVVHQVVGSTETDDKVSDVMEGTIRLGLVRWSMADLERHRRNLTRKWKITGIIRPL